MSSCRSCQAPIRWVGTELGRKMPLDLEPYTGPEPAGLFVVRGTTALAVTPDAFPGEPVYRSHFATCSDPARWRRPR